MRTLTSQGFQIFRKAKRSWWQLLVNYSILFVILAFLGISTAFPQGSDSPTIIQRGTLVPASNTTQGQHIFSLMSLPGGGFQLLERTQLNTMSGGATQMVFQSTANLLLSSDWSPVSFAADTDRAGEGRFLQFAQVNGSQVSIWKIQENAKAESTSFTVTAKPWIFADNISSNLVVLYQLWQAQGKPQTLNLTMIVTNTLAHASLAIQDMGAIRVIPNGGGAEISARELALSVEGEPFANVIGSEQGALLGLITPGQTEAALYTQELFPQGFSIK